LRLASDAAHALGLPLPAAALAETLFRAASAQGYGRAGTQAIHHVIDGLSATGKLG
jgi:3-hydroxyisobutyrate dehydrogenase-like beta-hydroxyacid dehydrogenase